MRRTKSLISFDTTRTAKKTRSTCVVVAAEKSLASRCLAKEHSEVKGDTRTEIQTEINFISFITLKNEGDAQANRQTDRQTD
jgi:hypothetical protein